MEEACTLERCMDEAYTFERYGSLLVYVTAEWEKYNGDVLVARKGGDNLGRATLEGVMAFADVH